MSARSNTFSVVFSTILIALFAAAAMADTVRLKDGSIIKGKIVTFSGGRFIIAIGDGERRRELTFAAADVESIEFDSQSVPAVSTTARVDDEPEIIEDEPPTVAAKDPVNTVPVSATREDTAPRTPAALIKPVELKVNVLADDTANGWTNSGWVVKKGQRIRISGTGEVSLGSSRTTTPSGLYDFEDDEKLLKNVPTGALIAVIGDDNNDFIYIGSEREFVAERDGALFLGLNEGRLDDNTGSFDVKVEIRPEGGE